MTLLEEIQDLTWFNAPTKLKSILIKLMGLSGGIQTISGDLVDNTDPLNPVLNATYKGYSALMSQTGTDDPTVTVGGNTIGDIVWTRVDDDEYRGTLAGAFEGVTTVFISNTQYAGDTHMFPVIYKIDGSTIGINPDGDGALLEASIEIKVFN